MAQDVRIDCINKRDRNNHHERIQNVGGVNADRSQWRLSEDDAIAYIKNGTYSFYTMVNSIRANVIVARHPLMQREYLTTRADNYLQNNLLHLPECP